MVKFSGYPLLQDSTIRLCIYIYTLHHEYVSLYNSVGGFLLLEILSRNLLKTW